MAVYFFYFYKYTKRREKEGVEFATPSGDDLMLVIFCLIWVVVCFVKMTGLWELLIRWLSSTK